MFWVPLRFRYSVTGSSLLCDQDDSLTNATSRLTPQAYVCYVCPRKGEGAKGHGHRLTACRESRKCAWERAPLIEPWEVNGIS